MSRLRLLAAALIFFFFGPTAAVGQHLDMDLFESMKPRSIGPAGMSGRVTAIDAVQSNPEIIYAGTASGGLWRSVSGGIAWEAIFEEEPAHSIGAVTVDQTNPDVIWVGTGEGNPRNSMSAGNGLYKSIDGGTSWTHLGLDASRSIHRILLDPRDSDVAYIGALGPAWGETETRGVFKTTDGGKTFEKILYVDVKTGPGDMVMDPMNPDHIIVGMWQFRRWPWFFKSGGEGSGLYVTYDGGANWKRQTDEDGLPEGELGRIGLAFARSDPDIAYALVESSKNALYRSTDGGDSWTKVNDKREVSNRPFYYQDIFVDPANENRVYHVAGVVNVSDDGGRSFKQLMQSYGPAGVHPDHHAFWISPSDRNFLVEGNDGGLNISRDRGKTWRFAENLPVAQFYHINVDNELPYNVMGGMQDNGSWVGPAYIWKAGGIRNSYWQEVDFGDGFDVSPDPDNARFGYAMSQGGSISRFDRETGYSKYIKPLHPDGKILRFNWNAGFAQDPFDSATIYYGSQFVHRSTDRGNTWELISPDLTTNDAEKQNQLESGGLTYDVTQAENFTTIVSIAPSPLTRGEIWIGTDDGNVQLTRDGGATWDNVGRKIKDAAGGSWVPQIRASRYNPGEAFVVIEDHRRNNWEPYVYRTQDWGHSWDRIVDSDDVFGYALSIIQDPVESDLIFLGTEFGLYVSIDDGTSWTKWTQGYPTASTMDLAIQEREGDLVIGTFGHAAWVLDDIRPLRALAADGMQILDEALHTFESPDAYQAAFIQAAGTRFRANAIFAGQNRPRGAMISYSINPDAYLAKPDSTVGDKEESEGTNEASTGKKAPEKVSIEILDATETVIRTFDGPANKGINRSYWSMTRKGVRMPSREKPKKDAKEPSGPSVLPGIYQVRVAYGASVASTQITVHPDPRREVDLSGLQQRSDLYDTFVPVIDAAREATDRLIDAKRAVDRVKADLDDRDDEAAKALEKKGKALKDSLDSLQDLFFGPKGKQGIYRDPYTVSAYLGRALSYMRSGENPPGSTEERAIRKARQTVQSAVDAVNTFFENEWPTYRKIVLDADIVLVSRVEAVEMK